ncbi:hypothetical protein C7H73_00920 [Pulveribacter suum]|uniref:Molecular chaperone DnaJ n=1 Tax=Pulveribacter suum TaxID=2116657 RepID=A0A2P1NHA6_9BURK|nr:hypothetical protein C7H73_00920 [Pulveribacter suum]
MSRLQVAPATAQGLNPAQQKFNRLLARVHQLEQLLQALQHSADALRTPHLQRMDALQRRVAQAQRALAHCLHERLQQDEELAAPQQRLIRERLRCLVPSVPEPQDEAERQAWQLLQSAYRPPPASLQERQAGLQALLDQFEQWTGQRPQVPGLDRMESPEQLLEALLRQEQERRQATAERRAERRAKRKPTARQQQEHARAQDASGALRAIYRQLASALHPDRERDPIERERKQALMSQANAANERGDLLALLRLQLAVEQVDEGSIARLGEERLASLSLLLQRQVGMLDKELAEVQARLSHELGVPVSACDLQLLPDDLSEQQQALEQRAQCLEDDLRRVREGGDGALRRWLREQARLAQEHARAVGPSG